MYIVKRKLDIRMSTILLDEVNFNGILLAILSLYTNITAKFTKENTYTEIGLAKLSSYYYVCC
jgi:hypothetical protein